MAKFRPYSRAELQNAAEAYNLDPAFLAALYAVESSNGTDPGAMTARRIVRPKSKTTTLVRGPFQITDETASDLIRKHKMEGANVDDPDTHLELAARLVSDLNTTYKGDYNKVAQAFFGGAGGVKNTSAKDELGTSVSDYARRVIRKRDEIRNSGEFDAPSGDQMMGGDPSYTAQPTGPVDRGMEMSPYMNSADAGDDSNLDARDLQLRNMMAAAQNNPTATGNSFGGSGGAGGDDLFGIPTAEPSPGSWRDMMAANSGGMGGAGGLRDMMSANSMGGGGGGGYVMGEDYSALGIPSEYGREGPPPSSPTADIDAVIAQLVNEEMDGRDYGVA